jgi:hypothetical protein
MIQNLDDNFKPLSPREEARMLSAIKSCPDVPDGTDRFIAQLSRNTLSMIIDRI